METKHLLAIEIGSSKVKGAIGTVDPDGILSVVAIEEEKIADSVRHGLIINVETVANRVLSVVRKLENRVSPRKARSVYMVIGGRSFRSARREIERQLPSEEEITTGLVNQLREEALGTALSDREVVDVVDGEYYVDHQQRNNPVGSYGRNIEAVFNLITCRLQAQRNLRRVITERLGLKINDLFVRQLAEGELVLSSDQRRQGCMLVDLGAETTTVSIYKFGVLRYMATLPIGSRNISLDIASLGYLEERAEEMKIVGGNASSPSLTGRQMVDGIDFTTINNYIGARATEIVANIVEQIKYADLAASDLPAGIVLVGAGAKLKGLSELMEKITKMKVYSGMPSATVHITDARIPAYDSIDVISGLYAASKLPDPVECMALPEPKPEPKPQPAPEPVRQPEPEYEKEDLGSIIDNESDDEFYAGEDMRPRRGNIFKRWRDKMDRILRDDDDDTDMHDDE